MVDHLTHQINDESIEIINKDFLNINLNKYEKDIIVLGNLPYYVTTEIVEKLIKCKKVKQMTLMVQKEAYFRLISPSNTKEYSPISIFIEYLGGSKLVQKVSRHSYIPEPHVDSLVFQINVTNDRTYENEKLFFQVTKAMFKMRRKTILNNLTAYLNDKNKALEILNNLNCLETKRPEQLDLKFYINLTNEIVKNAK